MSDSELRALALGAGTPEGALAYSRALRRVGREEEAQEALRRVRWDPGVEEALRRGAGAPWDLNDGLRAVGCGAVRRAVRERWRVRVEGAEDWITESLLVGSGKVVVTDRRSAVRVLRAEDGSVCWGRSGLSFRSAWLNGPWLEVGGEEVLWAAWLEDGASVDVGVERSRGGWCRVGEHVLRVGEVVEVTRWVGGEEEWPGEVGWRVDVPRPYRALPVVWPWGRGEWLVPCVTLGAASEVGLVLGVESREVGQRPGVFVYADGEGALRRRGSRTVHVACGGGGEGWSAEGRPFGVSGSRVVLKQRVGERRVLQRVCRRSGIAVGGRVAERGHDLFVARMVEDVLYVIEGDRAVVGYGEDGVLWRWEARGPLISVLGAVPGAVFVWERGGDVVALEEGP